MAHLEEDIIERAKNTDMIALLESEEGFSFKSTYGAVSYTHLTLPTS